MRHGAVDGRGVAEVSAARAAFGQALDPVSPGPVEARNDCDASAAIAGTKGAAGAAEGNWEMDAAKVTAAIIRGTEAVPVEVGVAVGAGIPGITVVGMPDSGVIEARSRTR